MAGFGMRSAGPPGATWIPDAGLIKEGGSFQGNTTACRRGAICWYTCTHGAPSRTTCKAQELFQQWPRAAAEPHGSPHLCHRLVRMRAQPPASLLFAAAACIPRVLPGGRMMFSLSVYTTPREDKVRRSPL